MSQYSDPYLLARYEHAWLLRAEGMTYRAVGLRLGVSGTRSRQMIHKFGRIVHGSFRLSHTKLTIYTLMQKDPRYANNS